MKEYRILGIQITAGAALFILAVFVMLLLSLVAYRMFGPQFMRADREIFQQSQQFIAGMNQDLGRRCREYDAEADATAKRGIGQYIIDQAAQMADEKQLILTVQQCLAQVRADVKGGQ